MAFNAGSIEATLTLNRNAFTAGLKAAKAEAERFARQKFEVTITPKLDRAGLTRIKQQIERVTGNISVKVKLDNASLQAVKARIDRTVGNINVRVKLDNASLQAIRARINSVAGRVEVKARLDNASLQAIRARIASVAGRVNVKVELDSASLAALKTRINSIRLSIKVKLDLDNSDLARLRAQLAAFRPTIKVRVEYDRNSIAQLGRLFGNMGGSVGGASSQMRILLGLLPLLLSVGAPAITGLIGLLGALTSAIGIAAAGLGAFALVGASVFKTVNEHAQKAKDATKSIASAYDQVGEAQRRLDKTVADSAKKNEEAQQRVADSREQLSRTVESAARADAAAEQQVADAHKNVAKAVESAARDNAEAQGRIADARQNLSDTIESAARADIDAEERVADARQNLSDVIESAARSNAQAEERVADAVQNLADVTESVARANEAAQDRIANARESLSETIASAARADVEAEERVVAAEQDVAKAVADAAKANASAQGRVQSAERSLIRTQQDAKRAQEDLNDARKDAVEELENLKLSLRGAALSEEQAIIDLAEAQEKFNEALHDGTSGTELKQLELNVRKAKLSLDESRESYGDLKEKSAEYAKTGIEGSEGVRNAQDKVAQANENIKDAERDVAEARKDAAATALEGQQAIKAAQEEVSKAQQEANQTHLDGLKDIQKSQENVAEAQKEAARTALDGQRQIADAQKDIARAQKDASQTALDGQRQVLEAQKAVAKAQADATQAHLDGQKSIQKAQEDIAKAQRDAAQTALDGQQRVLEAQEEATRAQKEATQTHLDGQRDILDAQKAVAEAQKDAAQVQLESLRAIQEATIDLAKAQRAYADALGEMPKKLLPGMQMAEDALNRLKASYQALVDRTSPATGAAFAAFFDAGTAALNTLDPLVNATAASLERFGLKAQKYFGTEDWAKFVDFLSQHVGPTLDKIFDAASHLMGGIKGLVVAFQPLADWMLQAIVDGLAKFDEWANKLAGDPAFQQWLKDVQIDLKILWDFLVEVVKFIANLVRDLEPFGRPIMQGLVDVLKFLNSLPPGMLGAIALGFSSIMAALIVGAGGPVALGIGALVAAGVALATLAKNSPEAKAAMEEFTTWLQSVWSPIWETIKTNFEEKIKPAFDRLVTVVKEDLWPAFQRFGAVLVEEVIPKIQPLIDTVTGKLIPALIDLLAKLAPIVSYMLDTWGPVIADVLGRTVTVFDGSLQTIAGLVKTVTGLISGDWKTFGEGLHQVAEGFWTIIAGLFGTNLDGLKQKFTDADNNIKRIWGDLGNWMSGIGSNFIQTVQQKFAEFGPWVSARTQEAADGINRAWRAVANFFREPINWVINVVINDGILRAWNTVMGWIGQPALNAAPVAQIPAFASGGMVRGPGTGTSDSILARVSAGEYIVPANVAKQNLAWLNSLTRFQVGGPVAPGTELGTGTAGATVTPGTTATAQSQSWWDRVGADATALFNKLRDFSGMPALASVIGQAITGIPTALINNSLTNLQTKLSNIFPPAAPGAENLDPAGNDPRMSAVFDRGGVLRPKTKAINASKYAERVLSPQQTRDFNDLVKVLNDMFHPTKTKGPGGGDIYHITLPKGASVRELANEIAFRKKVTAKGRYSPR